jgi:hypothetical protein
MLDLHYTEIIHSTLVDWIKPIKLTKHNPLIMVIFKLKYNNLILKEIMVLNSSYECLHAFSLHRESPDPDPGRWTPHF